MSLYVKPLPKGIKIPEGGIDNILREVKTLKPGETLLYHTGHLAEERRASPSVDKLAETVFDLANGDWSTIHLTQFRIGYRDFAYVATGLDRQRRRHTFH